MNERILELAKISGAWDYFNDGDKSAIMDQQALQNFAELIVQECVEVVKWTPSLYSNDEYVKNIKKHFGVEE